MSLKANGLANVSYPVIFILYAPDYMLTGSNRHCNKLLHTK